MMGLREYCGDFFRQVEFSYTGAEKVRHAQDKNCLSVSLNRFLASGMKQDAFNVYFCFCEIFNVFGIGYDANTKTLTELLHDYEMSAGGLADKQRDHYAHSVYVFAIGLSIYRQNAAFRSLLSPVSAREFLYRWGLIALFHDIGYPFEIAFTSIRSFTAELNGAGEENLYPVVRYGRLERFTALTEGMLSVYRAETGDTDSRNALDVLVKRLTRYFPKCEYRAVRDVLERSVSDAVTHMDHAWFAGVQMLKYLLKETSVELAVDTAASILAHNAFARYLVAQPYCGEKLEPERCPLAFLLLFADALQDYGRTCYGKRNRTENYPYDCLFTITDNAFEAEYLFDDTGIASADRYAAEQTRNLGFLNLSGLFSSVRVGVKIRGDRNAPQFAMSASFFKNILTIARQIHSNYVSAERLDKLTEEWNNLTLEYKLSNILQAQSYDEKLNRVGCFYDSRHLPYTEVVSFQDSGFLGLSREEHERWLEEKLEMGWRYGTPATREEREEKRIHNCLLPYDALDRNSREKDSDVLTGMIRNLRAAGFRIYRFQRSEQDRAYLVGFTGHRALSDERFVYYRVRQSLFRLKELHFGKLVLLLCMADGADLIAARAAMDLDIPVKAVLPKPEAVYSQELVMKDEFEEAMVYARQTQGCVEFPAAVEGEDAAPYLRAGQYLVDNCDLLLAVWNGTESGKRGGTSDIKARAEAAGVPVEVVKVL